MVWVVLLACVRALSTPCFGGRPRYDEKSGAKELGEESDREYTFSAETTIRSLRRMPRTFEFLGLVGLCVCLVSPALYQNRVWPCTTGVGWGGGGGEREKES